MPIELKLHPDFARTPASRITIDTHLSASGELRLDYSIFGDIAAIAFLPPMEPARSDYLWQKTCCEAFLGVVGQPDYLEFNFSPSTEWAAYHFDDHRRGMKNPAIVVDPKITTKASEDRFDLAVVMNISELPGMDVTADLHMAVSAVIEDIAGGTTLWALAHPHGNPDFHDRGCFVHKLEVSESS